MKSKTKSSSSIININRRRYAIALDWYVGKSQDAMPGFANAKEFVWKPRSYCLRPPNSHHDRAAQFGISPVQARHHRGDVPLAALLANTYPSSWIGLFRFGVAWWVIVVRDALIQHDGDRLFATEASALSFLKKELGRAGLEFVSSNDAALCSKLAPLVPKGVKTFTLDLQKVSLDAKRRWQDVYRLKWLYPKRLLLLLGGIVIAVIALSAFALFAASRHFWHYR